MPSGAEGRRRGGCGRKNPWGRRPLRVQRAGLRSSAVRGGVPECKVCGAARTLRGGRGAQQGTNRSPAGGGEAPPRGRSERVANEVASGRNGCGRFPDLKALSVRFRCSASHKGGYRRDTNSAKPRRPRSP